MTEQERWQLTADILDQLWQEVERQRKGSTLSNMAGIRKNIDKLVTDVVNTQSNKPVGVTMYEDPIRTDTDRDV